MPVESPIQNAVRILPISARAEHALDDCRNKDGDLSRKHGNTLIGTLRSHYGSDFAAGCSESDRLTDVLDQLDKGSLNKLARDYEAGKLAGIFPN